MSDYAILRVCTPYVFFGVAPSFLDFISPHKICPKKFFPIYILVNRSESKIIRASYEFSSLFSKQENLKKEEREKLKAKSIKISINPVKEEKDKNNIAPYNFEIWLSDQTDNKVSEDEYLIDELSNDIIDYLIEFTMRFRVECEKMKLETSLTSQRNKAILIKKSKNSL